MKKTRKKLQSGKKGSPQKRSADLKEKNVIMCGFVYTIP